MILTERKRFRIEYSKEKVGLTIFLTFLSISLPIQYILKVDTFSILFFMIVIVFYYYTLKTNKIGRNLMYFIIFSTITGILSAFHWGLPGIDNSVKISLQSINLVLTILIIQLLSRNDIYKFIEISSIFIFLILIGAWIAFFYRLLGGQPNYIFDDGGTPYHLFLTSFVKQYWGQLYIRPTGIFDEPGTFSFIISFIVVMRHLTRMNKRDTWIILSLGIITFSVALFLFMVIYLLIEKRKVAVWTIGVISLIVIVNINLNTQIYKGTDNLLLSRFKVSKSSDKIIEGDNRTSHFNNALSHLNIESFFWSKDYICLLNKPMSNWKYGSMGENPLWPLISRGILNSWPYYFILLLSILISLKKKQNLIFLGLAMLLLQRPYSMDLGYSFMSLLPLYYYYGTKDHSLSNYWIFRTKLTPRIRS